MQNIQIIFMYLCNIDLQKALLFPILTVFDTYYRKICIIIVSVLMT